MHPDHDHLVAYGLGTLDDAEITNVVVHLETCEICRQTVADTPSDAFLSALQVARPAPGAALPPELANHPRFRIVRELGRGGMGVVYLAEHRLMERPVAIKVINNSLVENPKAVERFHREVRAAAKLDHENIVRAYDAEQAGDLHMLMMEYVTGLSLAQVLEHQGRLPVTDACHYIRQAALALQHAFEMGMVHRDLKPQNLMLVPDKGVVKVLDFGLARLASERPQGIGLTAENAVMGTPEYIAPEQAKDAHQADIRADIYSLGCTLYCLLTGRPPFVEQTAMKTVLAHLDKNAVPLREVRFDVPTELSEVVSRMMAKDPTQRYQTPREVAEALTPFCSEQLGATVATAQEKKVQRRRMPDRRRRRVAALAAAAGVLGLGLVMGIFLHAFWPKVQYLSDMQEFEVRASEARFAKKGNLGYVAGDSGRIHVNGNESPNGLSMHAVSESYATVKYNLTRTAHTFVASVALNDSASPDGKILSPVTFQVLGDRKLLWSSEPVDAARKVQECKVDVRGVDVLELRVDCPGDNTNAQAVWLEPRLLMK